MAAVMVYWPSQHELVVSTGLHGSPLKISITEHSNSRKTAPKQREPQTDPGAQTASSPKILRQKNSDTVKPEMEHPVNKDKSVAIKHNIRPDTKAQTSSNESAPDDQVQKTARLNNNMIDYLNSEFKVRFKYPVLARKRGWQGEVLLNLDINRHGRIARVAIQRSSGYLILDHNAVKTFELIGEISPILSKQLFGDHHLSIPVVYQLTGS
jgi:protein TonB